jgi:hypothetical protein
MLVVVEPSGNYRRLELADHYNAIAKIELSVAAPDEARALFDRARHVFIYAWFDYELTPVAEQQAFAALEVAVRHRFNGDRRTAFQNLLKNAVRRGFLPAKLGQIDLPLAIASMRNEWAHGSTSFMGPGPSLDMIELCAELIGELFPPSA